MPKYTLQGGPQDGQSTTAPEGHFTEGDFVAVNYKSYATKDGTWSGECVYQVQGNRLVYDPKASEERRRLTQTDAGERATMNPLEDSDAPPCLPFMLLELAGEFMRSAKHMESLNDHKAAVAVATAAERLTEVMGEYQEAVTAWQIRQAAIKNAAAGIKPIVP